MRHLFVLFALSSFVVPVVAAAEVPPASGPSGELLVAETRRKVTDEIKRFLEDRCAQQCDVGEVSVKVVKRKPPVGSAPGFEEMQGDAGGFQVHRVDVNLLLDKRLPNDFRAGARQLIARKLEADGLPNAIHETLIHFPTPQELPDRAAPQPQPWAPPPVAPEKPAAKAEATPPAPVAPVEAAPRSSTDRLIDALPLFLGLLLCAAVVWFTLRQYQRLLDERVASRGVDPVKAAAERERAEEAAAARREHDRLVEDLKQRLAEKRPLAREVGRDLLANASPADAALSVAMVGPSLLDGLRRDPDAARGLRALDAYLAERSPPDSLDERKRVLADLERRLLRAQVAHGEAPDESAFAFLRDVPAPLFARLLEGEAPETQALILRHAPAGLVEAFLDRQPVVVRQALVAPLLSHAPTPRGELERVAADFQRRIGDHAIPASTDHRGGLDRPDSPVSHLLQVAPSVERQRLLWQLRGDPEALRTALGSFVADEALPAIEGEVLATAVSRLDATTAALFIGQLDENARKHVLASLPSVTARSVAEEAGLLAASPQRRASARRAALAAIRQAVEERGLDLAEINRRVLLDPGAGEAASS